MISQIINSICLKFKISAICVIFNLNLARLQMSTQSGATPAREKRKSEFKEDDSFQIPLHLTNCLKNSLHFLKYLCKRDFIVYLLILCLQYITGEGYDFILFKRNDETSFSKIFKSQSANKIWNLRNPTQLKNIFHLKNTWLYR